MATITIDGLGSLTQCLQHWARLHYSELLQHLSALVESQTRTRLADEQTSPDGDPWPKWSPQYTKTRHRHHQLLQNTGHLIESIHARLQGDTAIVGTNVRYAKAQQFGSRRQRLPARAFLGISRDNQHALQALVDDWVASQVTKH